MTPDEELASVAARHAAITRGACVLAQPVIDKPASRQGLEDAWNWARDELGNTSVNGLLLELARNHPSSPTRTEAMDKLEDLLP